MAIPVGLAKQWLDTFHEINKIQVADTLVMHYQIHRYNVVWCNICYVNERIKKDNYVSRMKRILTSDSDKIRKIPFEICPEPTKLQSHGHLGFSDIYRPCVQYIPLDG